MYLWYLINQNTCSAQNSWVSLLIDENLPFSMKLFKLTDIKLSKYFLGVTGVGEKGSPEIDTAFKHINA